MPRAAPARRQAAGKSPDACKDACRDKNTTRREVSIARLLDQLECFPIQGDRLGPATPVSVHRREIREIKDEKVGAL